MKKQISNKKLRYILPIGGLALVASSVVVPVIMVTKNSQTIETHAKLAASTGALQSYKVRTPYTVDAEGFVKMMNDAKFEYLNQFGIDYTETQTENWFKSNIKKAIETIEIINARILQRGFWDAIWSGIKGVAEGAAGMVATAVNTITGGAIDGLDSAAKTLLSVSGDSFNEAGKHGCELAVGAGEALSIVGGVMAIKEDWGSSLADSISTAQALYNDKPDICK